MGVPEVRPDDVAGQLLKMKRQIEALEAAGRRNSMRGRDYVVDGLDTTADPGPVLLGDGPTAELKLPIGTYVLFAFAASMRSVVGGAATRAKVWLNLIGLDAAQISAISRSNLTGDQRVYAAPGSEGATGVGDIGVPSAGGIFIARSVGEDVVVQASYGATGGTAGFTLRRLWVAAFEPTELGR